MKRRYAIYDVFTDRALAGNPLAVVFDAQGLEPAAMQAIAREFNLSETTFVSPPEDARHRARVRIFTPDYEMPFAGHPTVGTAIALADAEDGPAILVLEENIGPVRCAVSGGPGRRFAEFDLPKLPQPVAFDADAVAIAAALGLKSGDIGFDGHAISCWSAGVPYVLVPVNSLAAVAGVRFENTAWSAIAPPHPTASHASAYVYCRQAEAPDSAFHVRMFVPGTPSFEDPATGSAAAAFIGAVAHFDRPDDGLLQFWIEQGTEMGRPSRLRLEMEVSGGAVAAARIGGHAVQVAEGRLLA